MFSQDVIDAIIIATIEVFRIQAELNVLAGKTSHKDQGHHPSQTGVYSSIQIKASDFAASLFMNFPETLLMDIFSRMIGEKVTTLTEEVLDVSCEFSNMIFGHLKRELNKKGKGIAMALPERVEMNWCLSSQAKEKSILIPFNCGSETFTFFLYKEG